MAGSVAFGPVSSRRLGVSLGANNIPAKTCTYSCVYCQVGKTSRLCTERRAFFDAHEVAVQVADKLRSARTAGAKVDYITLVPDGEPTLDIKLGEEIRLLRGLGLPVAVITNASLLWRAAVREDLAGADLVSVKVDALDSGLWRRINRPHPNLAFGRVLDGIEEFARGFKGRLISETMIIGRAGQDFNALADFLDRLEGLEMAYVSTITRPPAEAWASPASEGSLKAIGATLSRTLGGERVSILPRHEGDLPALSAIDDVEGSVLGIVAVQPLREDVLKSYLMKAGLDWEVVEKLIVANKIRATQFCGQRYLQRIFEDVGGQAGRQRVKR